MIKAPSWAKTHAIAALACTCALGGCVSLKPVLLDRKTQLENQILGAFGQLDRELILVSSVRGARGESVAKLTPLQRQALEAMLDREFNRDDIDDLKAQQIIGEGNDGELELLLPPKDKGARAKIERLLAQENRDRQIIIRRVIQLDMELRPKDEPLVRKVFYRLNARTAADGHRLQRPDGSWYTVHRRKTPARPGGAIR